MYYTREIFLHCADHLNNPIMGVQTKCEVYVIYLLSSLHQFINICLFQLISIKKVSLRRYTIQELFCLSNTIVFRQILSAV